MSGTTLGKASGHCAGRCATPPNTLAAGGARRDDEALRLKRLSLARRTMTQTRCPICDFELGFAPSDGESPSDEICPSCTIQFRYNDSRPDLRMFTLNGALLGSKMSDNNSMVRTGRTLRLASAKTH